MDNTRVNVKIYGQEYVISGEQSKEEILKVANHVDLKMQEVATAAQAVGATPVSVATLAAINISSEYFKAMNEIEEIKRMNYQLDKDAQHYIQLWDESKKEFNQYKEETQAVMLQNNDLKNQMTQKEMEIARLNESTDAVRSQIQSGMEETLQEVENKCRELENSFFDLQMENLQLKKELEKYKKAAEPAAAPAGFGQF